MTFDSNCPFITVIIPVYNRAEVVLDALESVQKQTYRNFECLVIDDGSTDRDKLAAVVSSLNDDRFKYFHQENAGACSARNTGIDLARGSHIAFLDSDDAFVPEKLEKFIAVLSRQDGDVLVFSQMIVDRGLENIWVRPHRGPAWNEAIDEYLLCGPGKIQTSTMVLSTSLARAVRFDEQLPSLQDADFAIRVARLGARFEYINEPLTIFDDKLSESRVSRDRSYAPLLEWIEGLRGNGVSERSYWACRGWQCARVASYSDRAYALRLFFHSLIRRVYPARQAVVIFAQVALPHRYYQLIANYVVGARGENREDYRAE